MNWITIAWTLVASEAMEEILTHLWKVLVGQLHGPLAFRLILQPSVAVILAIRAGLGDARAGRPAYFWAVLMDLDHRKDLLREGWKDVGKIFVFAVVLDVICQLIVFRRLYPGEALLVAAILAILPYLVVRGPVNRIASCRTKTPTAGSGINCLPEMTTATQAFCEHCGLCLSATKTAESTSSRRFEGLGRAHLIYMFFGDEWSLVNVLGYLSPQMS